MKTAEQILVDGLVTIADTDKSGHVIQVLIETDDLERFIVDNNEIGVQLFDKINKQVKVTGVVINKLLNGYNILNVSTIKSVE